MSVVQNSEKDHYQTQRHCLKINPVSRLACDELSRVESRSHNKFLTISFLNLWERLSSRE
jgi:hypothetical protein